MTCDPLTAKSNTPSASNTSSIRSSVSAAPQRYVFYNIFKSKRKQTEKTYPCGAADTEERTLLASSRYSQKWRYSEPEEMNC